MLFPAFGFILSLSFKHLHKCLTKVLAALLGEVQHFTGLETNIYQSPLMTIIVIVVLTIKSFPFQGFCRLIFFPACISGFLTSYYPLYPLLLIVLHISIGLLSLFPSTFSFPASRNCKQTAVAAVIQQLLGQQGSDKHPSRRRAAASGLRAAEKAGGGIHP